MADGNDNGESQQDGQTNSGDSQTSQGETQTPGQPQGQSPQRGQAASPGQQAGDPGTSGGQRTDPQTGGQTGFTDPRLQGMSPREIENLVRTQEETIRQQGSRLNQGAQRGQQGQQGQRGQQGQQPQGQPQEPPVDEDEFWDNPVRATQKTVQRELQEAIEPLRRELQGVTSTIQSDRQEEQYRRQYPDWDRVKPYMESWAQRQGISLQQILQDPGITQTVYYSIKGMLNDPQGQAALTGQNGPQPARGQQTGQQPQQGQQAGRQAAQPQPAQQPGQPAQPQGQAPRSPAQQQPRQGQQGRQPAPPQHRPTSAPMQGQQGQQGSELRELTPGEEQIRKRRGMTKREFIEWQEAGASEVLEMERPGQGGE